MSIVDKMAEAIQVEDADCFPTINLQSKDYSRRLAQASWEVVKAEMLRDDVRIQARYAYDDSYWKDDATIAKSIDAALTAAIQKLEE